MLKNILKSCITCLLLAFVMVPQFAFAQGGVVTVSGVVTSAEDKLPLIGVTVVTEKMQGSGRGRLWQREIFVLSRLIMLTG